MINKKYFVYGGSGIYLLILLPFFIVSGCRTLKTFQDTDLRFSKEERISRLPSELHETSGLELLENSLISFNDSGGDAVLYLLSLDSINKPEPIPLKNAKNKDWEDIAADDNYIYTGDFGNNYGDRDTLIIYRIQKEDFQTSPLNPTIISFTFEEMEPENMNRARNPFDCEAMTIINDSLWLFTKNWRDKSSWIYKLPTTPGHYDLKLFKKLEPGMLVTGADFSEENDILILIGYNNFIPGILAYRLIGDEPEKLIRLRLGNRPGVQTEAIVMDGDIVYFSNEKSILPQGLFRILIMED
jgi:hypothetical protein